MRCRLLYKTTNLNSMMTVSKMLITSSGYYNERSYVTLAPDTSPLVMQNWICSSEEARAELQTLINGTE